MGEGQNFQNPDILRARFTVWIERVIKNARVDYLRQHKKKLETISMDELYSDEQIIGDKDVRLPKSETSFEFEEERLSDAFYKLPLMKRKILELLFVHDMKPNEIAKQMNCSAQYVYNQKLLAIKKLREQLCKDGDDI